MLVIQSKKLTITQKLVKLKIKILGIMIMTKYITQEFNNLASKNFTATLRPANLANKNDIADFVKRQTLIIN